jgi:hypothetical protein
VRYSRSVRIRVSLAQANPNPTLTYPNLALTLPLTLTRWRRWACCSTRGRATSDLYPGSPSRQCTCRWV